MSDCTSSTVYVTYILIEWSKISCLSEALTGNIHFQINIYSIKNLERVECTLYIFTWVVGSLTNSRKNLGDILIKISWIVDFLGKKRAFVFPTITQSFLEYLLFCRFKPVDIKHVVKPFHEDFEILFCETFSRRENVKFIGHLQVL